MPYGKGTYGSKVGRPPKKKEAVKPKKKPVKRWRARHTVAREVPRGRQIRKSLHLIGTPYTTNLYKSQVNRQIKLDFYILLCYNNKVTLTKTTLS